MMIAKAASSGFWATVYKTVRPMLKVLYKL